MNWKGLGKKRRLNQLLSWNSPGGTEEIHREPRLGLPVSRQIRTEYLLKTNVGRYCEIILLGHTFVCVCVCVCMSVMYVCV
jgi:hypothetical protein